jgi:purine-nucleoside phosphorylase
MSTGKEGMIPGGEADTAPRFDLDGALQVLEGRLPWRPEIFLVLGSGLGGMADGLDDPTIVPFQDLPGFPGAGVEGHQGRYLAAEVEGRRVLMQAGRFHFYEGYDPELVTAPVRLAGELGVRAVVLTNAAGGINRRFAPGDLMLLDDHINLQWRSPLAGPVAEGEERFPDMSSPYDPDLQELALRTAGKLGISLKRGVYVAVPGPSYETPAEIRMLGRLGGDAVGMSTVPEVIAARARGTPVMAISLITNMAAGMSLEPLSHEEVLEEGRKAGSRMERLMRGVISEMA